MTEDAKRKVILLNERLRRVDVPSARSCGPRELWRCPKQTMTAFAQQTRLEQGYFALGKKTTLVPKRDCTLGKKDN